MALPRASQHFLSQYLAVVQMLAQVLDRSQETVNLTEDPVHGGEEE